MILEPISARVSFSPLKSNLEDMVVACEELSGQMVFFAEDAEIFGLLTEDTFCDNAPQVLKLLERISLIAMNSTRDLTFEDEVFETDASNLALTLYSFLSEHRRAIDVLTAQKNVLKSTGSYYNSVGRSLNSQHRALQNFKNALEMRHLDIKERAADQWTVYGSTMIAATEAFPPPESA